jgi:hypothetical protein
MLTPPSFNIAGYCILQYIICANTALGTLNLNIQPASIEINMGIMINCKEK